MPACQKKTESKPQYVCVYSVIPSSHMVQWFPHPQPISSSPLMTLPFSPRLALASIRLLSYHPPFQCFSLPYLPPPPPLSFSPLSYLSSLNFFLPPFISSLVIVAPFRIISPLPCCSSLPTAKWTSLPHYPYLSSPLRTKLPPPRDQKDIEVA